jgi:superfamily II DNA or RNA helicase
MQLAIGSQITLIDGPRIKEFPYGKVLEVLSRYKDICKEIIWNVNVPNRDACKILDDQEQINIKNFFPRKFQQDCIDKFTRKTLTGYIYAPTGAGKTNIAAYLIAKRNIRTLVIVPKADLVKQTKKRFQEILDIDENMIGQLSGNKKEFGAPILIATWQSLNNDETLQKIINDKYSMVICDEMHKASANIYYKVVSKIPAMYKHGLTATPYRNNTQNEKRLFELVGTERAKVKVEDLYKDGFLVQPTIHLKETGYSININQPFLNSMEFNIKLGMLKKNIDKSKKRKEYIFNDLKNALFTEKQQYKNTRSVILVNTLDLAQDLQEVLSKDFNVLYVDANTKTKERSKIIDELTDGINKDYVLIGTSKLLGEGTDIPSIRNLFCVSPVYPPFEDTARLQQVIGRAVRPYEGKTQSNIHFYNDHTTGWIDKKKNHVFNIINQNVKPIYKVSRIFK